MRICFAADSRTFNSWADTAVLELKTRGWSRCGTNRLALSALAEGGCLDAVSPSTPQFTCVDVRVSLNHLEGQQFSRR